MLIEKSPEELTDCDEDWLASFTGVYRCCLWNNDKVKMKSLILTGLDIWTVDSPKRVIDADLDGTACLVFEPLSNSVARFCVE